MQPLLAHTKERTEADTESIDDYSPTSRSRLDRRGSLAILLG